MNQSPVRYYEENQSALKSSSPYVYGRKSQQYISPTFVSGQCFYPHMTPPKEQEVNPPPNLELGKLRDRYQEIFQTNYKASYQNYFTVKPQRTPPRRSSKAANTPQKSFQEPKSSNQEVLNYQATPEAKPYTPKSIKQQTPIKPSAFVKATTPMPGTPISRKSSHSQVSRQEPATRKSQANLLEKRCPSQASVTSSQSQLLHRKSINRNYDQYIQEQQPKLDGYDICFNCYNKQMVESKVHEKQLKEQELEKFHRDASNKANYFDDLQKVNQLRLKQEEQQTLISEYQRSQQKKQEKLQSAQKEKEVTKKLQEQQLEQERIEIQRQSMARLQERERFQGALSQQIMEKKKSQLELREFAKDTSLQVGEEFEQAQMNRYKAAVERQMMIEQREACLRREQNKRLIREKEKELERKVQEDFLKQNQQVQQIAQKQRLIEQQELQDFIEQQRQRKIQQREAEKQREDEYAKRVLQQTSAAQSQIKQEQLIDQAKQKGYISGLAHQIQMKKQQQSKKQELEKSLNLRLDKLNKSYEYLTKPITVQALSKCHCCQNNYKKEQLTKIPTDC